MCPPQVPTAVATSTVNVAAIAYKDRAYASLTSGRAAVFPLSSYGLFAMRDGLTVVSSFVLKNSVRDTLQVRLPPLLSTAPTRLSAPISEG